MADHMLADAPMPHPYPPAPREVLLQYMGQHPWQNDWVVPLFGAPANQDCRLFKVHPTKPLTSKAVLAIATLSLTRCTLPAAVAAAVVPERLQHVNEQRHSTLRDCDSELMYPAGGGGGGGGA